MTIRALKSTPVLLLVLGLLSERPMHPYEMQRLVVERGKHAVMDIKRGSIYHAVDRLVQAGLVEPQETSRDGRRPERTVYRITPEGEEEVRDWMGGMLSRPKDEYPEFASAVSFLPLLDPRTVEGLLRARLIVLDGRIGGIEGTLRSVGDRLPRVFLVEEEYLLAMARAEREWVAALVEDLSAGRLRWAFSDFEPFATAPPLLALETAREDGVGR